MEEAQATVRDQCRVFFQNDEYFKRLEYIFKASKVIPDLFKMIDHFLTKQDYNVPSVMGDQLCGISLSFKSILFANKKSIFDVLASEGSGPLVWKGQPNPLFRLYPEKSEVEFTVPVMNVLRFMIQIDADKVFWTNYQDIRTTFETDVSRVKRSYIKTHRDRMSIIKARVTEEIIQNRPAKMDAGDLADAQADSNELTKEERDTLRERVAEEEHLARVKRRLSSLKRSRRNKKPKRSEYSSFMTLGA
jgi:hypothetical protein